MTSETPVVLTPAEITVLAMIGAAFNAYQALPKLHPSDLPEFVQYTHALQNIVLSRPAMRALYADQKDAKP